MIVRGDVQGVGYRYTMRIVAREAGVAGWVRNLRDGSVEAEVEGTDAAVDEVLSWMAEGPPGSRVESATVTDAATLRMSPVSDAWPRVLVAGLFHETNTFLPDATPLADFGERAGAALLAAEGDGSPLVGTADDSADVEVEQEQIVRQKKA